MAMDYGSLAQGIGSAVQGVLGISSVALNNNQQWRNWKRQHEYLLQDWYRQNAYNSPAQQMRRFEAAGLNPNLVYGQQNTAGSIDTPAPPSAESPLAALDVEGAVNAYLNRKIQLRQLEIQQHNSDALVKLYAAKENQANTSSALNTALTALRTLQHEGYSKSGYYTNQGILQQKKIEETMNKIKLLISNTTIADLQGQFLQKTLQNRIRAVGLRNQLLSDQHGLNVNISRLQGKQASLLDEKFIGMRADNDFKILTLQDRRNLLKWQKKVAAAGYLNLLDQKSIRDLDYLLDYSDFSQQKMFNAMKFGKNALYLPYPGGSLW